MSRYPTAIQKWISPQDRFGPNGDIVRQILFANGFADSRAAFPLGTGALVSYDRQNLHRRMFEDKPRLGRSR
jgi:hypothetical protein